MKSLGEIAYTAYCENVQWKSVRGEALPDFSQVSPRIRHAWEIAALAVSNTVTTQIALSKLDQTQEKA